MAEQTAERSAPILLPDQGQGRPELLRPFHDDGGGKPLRWVRQKRQAGGCGRHIIALAASARMLCHWAFYGMPYKSCSTNSGRVITYKKFPLPAGWRSKALIGADRSCQVDRAAL